MTLMLTKRAAQKSGENGKPSTVFGRALVFVIATLLGINGITAEATQNESAPAFKF